MEGVLQSRGKQWGYTYHKPWGYCVRVDIMARPMKHLIDISCQKGCRGVVYYWISE